MDQKAPMPPPYPSEFQMPQPNVQPVTTQPQYIPVPSSFQPSAGMCPLCQQQCITNVEFHTGVMTWSLCVVISVFGGIFGCCLIPFCCDSCKDATHSCPRCGSIITTVKRC
ncbi:unnamed protein product [Dicrocoelium dendriticum]|nr:unnamed protein product [Dicrocoelium dendriticum]